MLDVSTHAVHSSGLTGTHCSLTSQMSSLRAGTFGACCRAVQLAQARLTCCNVSTATAKQIATKPCSQGISCFLSSNHMSLLISGLGAETYCRNQCQYAAQMLSHAKSTNKLNKGGCISCSPHSRRTTPCAARCKARSTRNQSLLSCNQESRRLPMRHCNLHRT